MQQRGREQREGVQRGRNLGAAVERSGRFVGLQGEMRRNRERNRERRTIRVRVKEINKENPKQI